MAALGDPPSGETAAPVRLYEQRRPAQLLVAPPGEPAANSLLDGDSAATQPVGAQLLQVGDLARAEEDLRPSELVLVAVLVASGRGSGTERERKTTRENNEP